MRTTKELRGMTNEEITDELNKTRKLLLEIKMGLAQSQLKKVSDIKLNRVYIAQMMTIINERKTETAVTKSK